MSHVQPVRLTALARPFGFFSVPARVTMPRTSCRSLASARSVGRSSCGQICPLFFFLLPQTGRLIPLDILTRGSRLFRSATGTMHLRPLLNWLSPRGQLCSHCSSYFFFFSLFLFPQSPNARIFPGIDFQFESDAGVRAKPLRKSILVYEHTL